MENPFTLTFGQKPTEFISRTNQIGKIIHTFDMQKTPKSFGLRVSFEYNKFSFIFN